MRNLISTIFFALFSALLIYAQPTTAPVLRIETVMHTATIRIIGTDQANRYLVTASDDKTARIWDLQSGELLRTLRVPIGEGNEGKLYAVAMSPDGNTVAVGGWTKASEDFNNIYIFERSSGKIIKRIQGLPNAILHLVFSANGKYLAASLGKGGVRLFETNGWTNIGQDTDYGSDSYGVDFDASGSKMVTSCLDGYLRLYQVSASGLTLLAKKTLAGGKQPLKVKFSPDGNKIVVGFNDSTSVNVVSAGDLSLTFSPDTTGVNNGNLFSVAWSSEGSTLYAGGSYDFSGEENGIRFWINGGRGSYRETSASLNTIFDILTLRNGDVVYGTADPGWGILDVTGKRTKFIKSNIADYRNNLEAFQISQDASEVQFGYQSYGKQPTRFSITDKRLEEAINKKASLSSAVTNTLNITSWEDTYEPKLNSVKLALKQYEMSRSLAIATDASKFLLGTEWYLRLFDRMGKELWKIPAPDVAWSVNISKDGRLAVAAFGDGTIRWYRITDGRELLAFFPHNDRKRWVLWTPSGYYDASADGEELIGWHVNNGKDAAADFFPAGLFRNQFYRPDVVSNILYTLDEAKALQFANEAANRRNQPAVTIAQQLPPVVSITSPADNAEVSNNAITLRYNVRTPSGEPVTKVRFMIDGRPVEARGVGVKPVGDQTATINIPEKDCVLSIVAENQFTTSEASAIRLKWKGQIASSIFKPKLYVLAIGVSKYKDVTLTLGFPAKDANDFVNVMLKQKGLLYSDVEVKTLTNEQATRAEIVDAFDWISRQTTSKDVAMVFMAGHGDNDLYGQYYFLPHDTNAEKIKSTGVVFSEIENTIKNLPGKTLFFIDTCKSANVLGSRKRELPDVIRVVNELSSAENGAVVFTASTKNEASLEDAKWNNGAFTKALVEGLSGLADRQNTGRVTIAMLDLYITERVKQLTDGRQHPVTRKPDTVPDFPLAFNK
jgi:WD40 repeat protein